jgi:chromosome partitioning protein
LRAVPRDTEILVIDAPARTHGPEMNELVRRAETILVPVLPSPIDMKACAYFMSELLELGKVQRQQARLAVVANRVRENTLMFEELDQYLGKLKVPYLASLRQSANYLRAFQRGMGIFEQWEPVTKWLGSKKSQPS